MLDKSDKGDGGLMDKELTLYQKVDIEQLEKMLTSNIGAIEYWRLQISEIYADIHTIQNHNFEIYDELKKRGAR